MNPVRALWRALFHVDDEPDPDALITIASRDDGDPDMLKAMLESAGIPAVIVGGYNLGRWHQLQGKGLVRVRYRDLDHARAVIAARD